MKKKSLKSAGFACMIALAAIFTACSESVVDDSAISNEITTLKSASDIDTLVFFRHPNSAYTPARRMYGISLSAATATDITSDTVTTNSGYDMYFYNEKAYDYCDSSSSTGTPFIVLNNSYVTADSIGYGSITFASCTIAMATDLESDITLTLPLDASYRCGSTPTGKLLKSTVADISSQCVIGNRFQDGTSSPVDQNVYIIKDNSGDEDVYYAFMIYSFKNTDNSKKITILIKELTE